MTTAAEKIADMKRENARTRAILDGIVLHPSDIEGRQQLEQQLANNRAVADLLDKMETAFSEAASEAE